jgi:hypothetical protein
MSHGTAIGTVAIYKESGLLIGGYEFSDGRSGRNLLDPPAVAKALANRHTVLAHHYCYSFRANFALSFLRPLVSLRTTRGRVLVTDELDVLE